VSNILCRWEDDVVGLVQKKHGNKKVLVSFECETLKADKAAEEHISRYMPNLCGLDAVGKHGVLKHLLNQQSLDH
jgi:polyphosphate kinase 2 (PPK2 family)